MSTRYPIQHTGFAVACAVTFLATSVTALAQDRADIDRTRITGNRELPKVLYIVPWKKPLPAGLSGRPLVSVLDEALAPLDRDVVRREVRYDDLTRAAATATANAAQPASASPPAK